MKIVVLAGGYSPEREVSLSSGTLIANALRKNGHRVLLLDVYMGMDVLPRDPDELFTVTQKAPYAISQEVPDLALVKERSGNGERMIGKHVLELCAMADRVFLALHGSIGENGQLQATLDNFGIPYTGSGYAGSFLAMDKDIAKRLLRDCGVPTPDWVLIDPHEKNALQKAEEIGLPAVVKPIDCGSSVGVSMIYEQAQLEKAIRDAAKWSGRVMIEKMIKGREITVGILEGKALPVVEIIPEEGFYDYKNKYTGSTREVCPAQIPEKSAKEAQRLALLGFDALRLSHYARFDFLLDEDEGLWCLEANTLPGMTPTSLLPLAAQTDGIEYEDLCERLVRLGLK